MKKIALILLTAFYMLPAIGFSINVHWCAGKISSVKFATIQNDNCACGKEMKKGCCKDNHTIIKLTDNQKVTTTLGSPTANLSSIILFTIPKTGLLYSDAFFSDLIANHPIPLLSKQPVY